MKFGTLYAYWGNEWKCDYREIAERVKGIGFDILEVGADHLTKMSNAQLDELKAVSKDLDLILTANIGPAKDKDVASADPQIREAGIAYLTSIMKAMDRIDSRSIVGVMYSYWPCDFQDVDKPAAWDRGVQSVKRLCKVAEDLGIEYCMEVVNRFETFILNTAAEGVQYCKDVDSKACKLLMDTFHELNSIAAVVIGGTSINGGEGSMIGTLIGVLTMGTLQCGMDLLGASSAWQKIILGVVIVGVVTMDNFRRKKVAQ